MSSDTGFWAFTRTKTFRRRFSLTVRLIISLILIFFSIFPVLWILSASLNPVSTLAGAKLIPDNWGFGNFDTLFSGKVFPFWTVWWNSIKIASITTILVLFITTTAAYAFSRFRFAGRLTLLKAILLIQVFPSLLAIVAIFLMISEIGKIDLVIPGLNLDISYVDLDTHTGLILVYMGGAMGINIWLMKGFLDTIPRDIDESAMVDGASHWTTFTRLILPLLRPILVVIGILTFIGVYGDFVLARILLKDKEQLTLMVALQTYTSGMFGEKWGPFSAGALLGALPIMVVYLALQDQIVGGLTQGAVKG